MRTLEVALGQARASGAARVWATGAFGSNHVLATAVHARAAGLEVGALVFPQPASEPAMANLGALLAREPAVKLLASVVELPFAMAWLRRYRRSAASFRNRAEWSAPALVLLRFDPDPRSATALRKADPHWSEQLTPTHLRDAVTHRSISAGTR